MITTTLHCIPINVQISGRMASIAISDVVTASVYSSLASQTLYYGIDIESGQTV